METSNQPSRPSRLPGSAALQIGVLLALVPAATGFAQDEEKTPATQQPPWQLIEIDGSDHVSVENLQKFYHFDRFEIDDSGVATLANPRLEVQFDPGDQWILLNGIRIKPCLPIQQGEGNALYLSTRDLAKTIEPSLRPSRIALPATGDRGPIPLLITQAPELSPPWAAAAGSPDDNDFARIHLHLQPSDGPLQLRSEVLTPAEREEKPSSGNAFDALNLALAVSCHAHLHHSLENAEDLGITRTRDPRLAESDVPTFRMTLSLPDDSSPEEHQRITQILHQAIQRFQAAISD